MSRLLDLLGVTVAVGYTVTLGLDYIAGPILDPVGHYVVDHIVSPALAPIMHYVVDPIVESVSDIIPNPVMHYIIDPIVESVRDDLVNPIIAVFSPKAPIDLPAGGINTQSIYDDTENTHGSRINRTIADSVASLLRDPKPIFTRNQLFTCMTESGLSTVTVDLIKSYCLYSTVHSTCNLTYIQLLIYIWQRICKSEHKSELLKILTEQVAASRNKCFMGRFNRLLSVLAGFYDDIVIEISDCERINAIVLATKRRVRPYDKVIHCEQARQKLLKAGYAMSEIKPWLRAISEP